MWIVNNILIYIPCSIYLIHLLQLSCHWFIVYSFMQWQHHVIERMKIVAWHYAPYTNHNKVQQTCVFGHHHIQNVHFYSSITFTTMQLIAKWLRKENMKCWLGIPCTIAKRHWIWIDLKISGHHLHNAYFHTSIPFATCNQTTPWLRQNKNTIYKSQKGNKSKWVWKSKPTISIH